MKGLRLEIKAPCESLFDVALMSVLLTLNIFLTTFCTLAHFMLLLSWQICSKLTIETLEQVVKYIQS